MPSGQGNDIPDTPEAVGAIRDKITDALNLTDDEGRTVGNAKYGVYAFYDYDGEPIYVGQTRESLRTRIRRHLTNQRTDAVAMNVLDPFEVAEIEMWPFFHLEGSDATNAEIIETLAKAEYTVYERALENSRFHAVLNEKEIPEADTLTALPPSARASIIPEDLYEIRKHPDVRIARRASTIANLARVISERSVSKGLRNTLLTQARRLEWLASQRLVQVAGEIPVEEPGEETGEHEAVASEQEDA